MSFFTSMSFLYAFVIILLMGYGIVYYRKFARSGATPGKFPLVFGLIAASCFFFLYVNMHAPLRLGTFSNLDHHFIRHDGFCVSGRIELGRKDTAAYQAGTFNRFVFEKKNRELQASSVYAEEPFFVLSGKERKSISPCFPAGNGPVSFHCDSLPVTISATAGEGIQLRVGGTVINGRAQEIRKGITVWNLFRDDTVFMQSPLYSDEKLAGSLRQVILLRDGAGNLVYFLSGKIFRYAGDINYNGKQVQPADLSFTAAIPDGATIGWGAGFPENNRNQFRVKYESDGSFTLRNRYPVSYPLTEENNDERKPHSVGKFLVSDPKYLAAMPAVFSEGFLFPAFPGDSTIDFAPVLLTYHKGDAGASLQWQAKYLDGSPAPLTANGDRLLLPAVSGDFSWVFSLQDSFNWRLGNRILSARDWQLLIFGTLFFYFILVFSAFFLRPAHRQNWIWQLLSGITLVMLTTRFFLYWRYKSFPPYEGLDLPSLQQLNSPWNFGIIILAGIALALIFGYGTLKYLYNATRFRLARWQNRHYRIKDDADPEAGEIWTSVIRKWPLLSNKRAGALFIAAWMLILLTGGAIAAMNHFEPATCRHLAIGLVLFYFTFVFISYQFSPLVTASGKSWWGISTGSLPDMVINNPVKVLLSVSLLALFGFIDMGFAIIFLNFLLFNEAFLCINFALGGLSAGSRKNAAVFGMLGLAYLGLFIINLLYGPYIFKYLLELPQLLYLSGYFVFSVIIAYAITRLVPQWAKREKVRAGILAALFLFGLSYFFLPRERILEKAAMTRYRIDVMTMPAEQAIEKAYASGKTWEPVIRAAQNQWFINTFIYEKNNPGVNSAGFHLLPHAPQNKGAKYNAQATDLVTSRFLLAEHGRWSVLLYALLLLLPATLLAYFYKLYPDFSNRTNQQYPALTTAFSLLNYLLVTALLVILAATGRYIFFGQDLPFGSILSKQSVLFPSALIVIAVYLLRPVRPERYPHRHKIIPGAVVFSGLALLLFLVKPGYNKNSEFGVEGLAGDMDNYIQSNLQPLLDEIDTSKATRRLSPAAKDRIFTGIIRDQLSRGALQDGGKFFMNELGQYARSGFSGHLDQRRLLYLDFNTGRPQLAVNDNYFRIEAPPHLRQAWRGSVFGDTTHYQFTLWDPSDGTVIIKQPAADALTDKIDISRDLQLVSVLNKDSTAVTWHLVNTSGAPLALESGAGKKTLERHDTLALGNPDRIRISDTRGKKDLVLLVQPDAFMRNLFVNGGRYYVYPMGSDFTWARNFAESVSTGFTDREHSGQHVFISLDAGITDSLSMMIQAMMSADTSYHIGAEYGICMADGNGRLLAMPDHIKGLLRPDPNDKPGFDRVLRGENGIVSQSRLRRAIGNINLLRMRPGPGSTLKPVVFSAIASQLDIDWNAFAAEGFDRKQELFGGEKVAEYDFEKNNGRIASVADYLKYSDNYYHSNVLLLGSYSRQSLSGLLMKNFATNNPDPGLHWPYFSYNGKTYWLDGFEHWPGYASGKADFGSDSSFISIGLLRNFGIFTCRNGRDCERLAPVFDSLLFRGPAARSGFVLPEYALFDQKGTGMDMRKPNEVFMSSFRGHVKGSSQVMIPPVKMLDAYGKLVSQNRNYSLTFNPHPESPAIIPFYTDNGVNPGSYLSLMRESVFTGMREALFRGTAARLGALLKNGSPYYYYAKTGTTGDEDAKDKSKLFAIVISQKDISDPDFNFRNNKFVTIYFTSQNGPAKQNEEFQAAVIKYIERSPAFRRYMTGR